MSAPAAQHPGTPPSVAHLVPERGEHGLARFAGVLAAGMDEAGVPVTRVGVTPGSLRALAAGLRRVRGIDILHVQYTQGYWGSGWHEVAAVTLLRLLHRHALVVTAHDFHTPPPRHPHSLRGWWRRLRRLGRPSRWAARILLGTADLVVTCSAREMQMLAWTSPRRTAVVPHYVEERHGPADARQGHGQDAASARIVVLGWVHGRKGQHWAVRTLPHLPGAHLVIAGGAQPQNQPYLISVLGEAASLGVAERTVCTGTLPDDDLDRVLGGVDVALAPYDKIAASGSIATLVAAGVPIVVRDSPALAELRAACPTALVTYEGNDPREIADAVRRCLAADRGQQRRELETWAAAHRPELVAGAHLDLFSRLMHRPRDPGGAPRRSG